MALLKISHESSVIALHSTSYDLCVEIRLLKGDLLSKNFELINEIWFIHYNYGAFFWS